MAAQPFRMSVESGKLREVANQVPDPRIGIAHNIGGPTAVSAITVLGKESS